MRKIIHKLRSNDLVRASAILMIGNMLGNVAAYAFSIIQARILTPEKFGEAAYGEFFTLNSIAYFFLIPITSITMVSSKVVAERYARNELSNIKSFVNKTFRITIFITFFITFIGVIISPFLQRFLNIRDESSTILLMLSLTLALTASTVSGAVNGMQRYTIQSAITAINAIVRLIAGTIFSISLGVMGAVSGNIAGTLVNILLSVAIFYFLTRDVKIDKNEKINFPFKLLLTSIISTFAFSSFLATDVILVKHYLSGIIFEGSNVDVPSIYSMLSIFGRIVFFVCVAFSNALLPLASFTKAKDGNHNRLLIQTLLIVTLILVPILLLYIFVPEVLVSHIYGNNYLAGAKYIGIYGLAVGFYSYASIFNSYFISIGRKAHSVIPAIGAIGQIVLSVLFHDKLENFIYILLFVNLFTFAGMFIYWFKTKEKNIEVNRTETLHTPELVQ